MFLLVPLFGRRPIVLSWRMRLHFDLIDPQYRAFPQLHTHSNRRESIYFTFLLLFPSFANTLATICEIVCVFYQRFLGESILLTKINTDREWACVNFSNVLSQIARFRAIFSAFNSRRNFSCFIELIMMLCAATAALYYVFRAVRISANTRLINTLKNEKNVCVYSIIFADNHRLLSWPINSSPAHHH